MIKTLDLQRNVTAILENAYEISYTKINNQIWKASFSLPINDSKVKKVKLLKYVEIKDEDEYIGLFRIIPKRTSKSSLSVIFECEHVLATLLGSTLFRDHQLINLPTNEVLVYLLEQQKEKHWKLGTVEIIRYFHYLWENENLLAAIFSVTKPFDEQYRWTWDTTSYPWTLNLVRPETEPVCRIKERHNLIDFEIEENPMSVYNRIYPLGYGEGVNQLTIESVNGGIPYIEDTESIAENGLMETTWADKRFKDAATLKASGAAVLKKWKEPIVSWRVTAADVSKITGAKLDELKEGNIVRLELDDYPTVDLRIMKEHKPDTKGDKGKVQLEIGSLSDDLSTTQADLERRQQINELYAQGATNLLAYSYNDNADQDNPGEIMIYLPDEMVNINKLLLTYKTDNFRAYEQATEGGGATSVTSSSGGGSSVTSSSGGGTTTTTESGGGTSTTTQAGGDHYHRLLVGGNPAGASFTKRSYFAFLKEKSVSTTVNLEAATDGDIYTYEASGGHSHNFTVLSHSHALTIPNHTHVVVIQNHTHITTLPNHTHAIKFGIYKHPDLPSKLTIRVDGNIVNEDSLEYENLDIIDFLDKDSEGKVTRGWHTISITPDKLGRVNANVISQFFIQSRGGGNF